MAATPIGSAVLRHVSSEGCQLVSGDLRPGVGQRLRFKVDSVRPITGTVRWSVGDRAGFEFDEPISARALGVLQRYHPALVSIRLYSA
ncbi:PilZ domain-containing protein [Novosphingobium album (ex Liu et al. 2023)]|uniref:PilZ domain-containing protein n=1 Tax=Novosphingobium album (ex Liu et al. 2023) TaxID=3031130 RepID=A0ABT5WJ75_9SPHN|nr:PilZ domain-containing protein [Novosphingobium album (ex Liu et al. 2023)]MDE8650107.1 PilZ domain-containing protein [Novosphingobium album (ex Liu et al. 2023)]